MDFSYIAELLEKERDLNEEFRKEVREELGCFTKWVAVHEALDAERSKRNKVIAWGVGTIVSVASVVIPLLVN